jgi:hypothetical protein
VAAVIVFLERLMSLSQQLQRSSHRAHPLLHRIADRTLAMWRACEWAYRSVLNKRRELYEISRLEVDYWRDRAEKTTREAAEQIELLERPCGLRWPSQS